MTYFADTHYFLALLNPNDRAFAKAQQLSLGDRELLVTTEWILMELADGLSTARNRTVFLTLYQRLQIRPNVQIVAADHALFQRAVNFFERRQDKDWSLTDCTSFLVMQEQGISEALTADHHFEQAGFVALLK